MGRPSSSSPTEETYLVNAAGLMLTDSRFEEGLAFQRLISTTGVENCLAAGQGVGNTSITAARKSWAFITGFRTSRSAS